MKTHELRQIIREEIMEMYKSHGYKKSMNEAWNDFLRGPRTDDAARDSYKSKGFSHSGTDDLGGKNPTDFVVFNGKKFFAEDLLFASVQDTGEIPRIEGDKLIIANPAWKD